MGYQIELGLRAPAAAELAAELARVGLDGAAPLRAASSELPNRPEYAGAAARLPEV